MNNLDAVFVDGVNFCQTFLPAWKKYLISSSVKQRHKPSHLSVSKVRTIVIAFHQSGYRDFKTYYIHFVCRYLTNEFHELVSHTKMLKLMQRILVSLCSCLTHRQKFPSLIQPSYRFVTTYAYLDIRFLKAPRSEEKER
uniref:hypothetical protein n=1 Tax=Candidatus Enterovibrio escicola TaxID=1927127 RepID=UPI001CC22F9D|nr:hypothetical protein [Candidatus Enterovibrio escacola]